MGGVEQLIDTPDQPTKQVPNEARTPRARRKTLIPDDIMQGVHSKSCPCETCITATTNELMGKEHY